MKKLGWFALVAPMALLVACGGGDGEGAKTPDAVEQDANKAGEKVEEGVEKTGDKAEEAGDKAQDATKDEN